MIPNFQPFKGDGRIAMSNVAAAFWQSRMSSGGRVAKLPAVIDVQAFARKAACMEVSRGRLAPPRLPPAAAPESSRTEN